ncbi:hypothetical protein [Streptomyces sp. LN549]|uniref:hypothetical protein n=1 Tax=Streptomyces sp. LN549 TaxID=3112979 RepID=UPI00371B5213
MSSSAKSRPGATYARVIAALGAQAKQGGIEQACTTWDRAIDIMAGVKSTGTSKRSAPCAQTCARELDERARVFLAHHR